MPHPNAMNSHTPTDADSEIDIRISDFINKIDYADPLHPDQSPFRFYPTNCDYTYNPSDPTDPDYIPRYDELSIEGRYYTYGSRSDYNSWRRDEIDAIRSRRLQERADNAALTSLLTRIQQGTVVLPAGDLPADDLPLYDNLPAGEQTRRTRQAYNQWRNHALLQRAKAKRQKQHRRQDIIGCTIAVILLLAIYIWYLMS